MSTYVLIPGGGWGGIVWSQVAGILRAAGHRVFAVTLTGLGERAHLASPDVDLDTHIRDVVGVLEYYDLLEVVLVGHSYGGMVITGAADKCGNRIAHLVFVAAHAPRDGESAAQLCGAAQLAQIMEIVREHGESWWWAPPADAPRFMTPHPVKTLIQPISLKNPALLASIAHTYVCCTEPRDPWDKSAERARTEGWRYCEFATGHMVMLTMPNQFASLLLELA